MTREFKRSASTTYYTTNYQYSYVPTKENDGDSSKMHGSRRVITFCFLTTILPTMLIVLPLYLRNHKYADVMYKISDSDVIQIHKGQSSIFCEKHSLRMNTSFNAFQMKGVPELSGQRKHIRLKKSMTLPDDTLEYWGFHLLKGATVELKACSRYEGSKILVVKGDRILNTCGILEGYKYKKDPPIVENQGSVLVTLEDPNNRKKQSTSKTSDTLNDNILIETTEDLHIYLPEKTLKETIEDLNVSLPEKTLNKINNTNIRSEVDEVHQNREKRSTQLHNPNTVLDTGVNHGGNALNNTEKAQDTSVSSFENNLHTCYQDNILMNDFFPFAIQCNSTNYLEKTTTLKVVHEVLVDGYYYYIFYSDNDFVRNDIHAIFDIYKPTFQYVNNNNSQSKTCLNTTECEFNVSFFSDELVIVEVPTKDGLQNDKDDISVLISVCHPRVTVYIVFPISVLLLILLFAFL